MNEIKREFARAFEMIKQKSGLDPSVIEAERNVTRKTLPMSVAPLSFFTAGLVGIERLFCGPAPHPNNCIIFAVS
jgi:hypothetical protein